MESFDPFSQWLGRSPGRPPKDHYELLGLARFEPDLDLIAHAVDMLRAKIRKIRPGSHLADWQRLLDRLEAAKICLSDPISKAAYDESIDTASHTLNVSGDPIVTWDSPDQEMAAALTGEASYPDGADAMDAEATAAPTFVEAPPVVGEHGQEAISGQQTSAEAPFPQIRPTGGKRKRTRLAVQFLVVSVVLLSLAIGLVALKRPRDVRQTVNPPQQDGTGSSIVAISTKSADSPPSLPPDQPVAREDPRPATPRAATDTPAPTPQAATLPPPEPPAASATPPAGSTVDPARQQAFRRAATSARTALANRDMTTAAAQLNEAVSLAQTDEERAEANQIEVLRAHVEAFWESLYAQIPRLESGSEIQVGEMMVVVVETGPDYLILRITGQNRRYSIAEMPHVLAAAMAERVFSKSSNASALRASFLIAEAKGDADRARQLLEEASQGGVVVNELLAELNRPH